MTKSFMTVVTVLSGIPLSFAPVMLNCIELIVKLLCGPGPSLSLCGPGSSLSLCGPGSSLCSKARASSSLSTEIRALFIRLERPASFLLGGRGVGVVLAFIALWWWCWRSRCTCVAPKKKKKDGSASQPITNKLTQPKIKCRFSFEYPG